MNLRCERTILAFNAPISLGPGLSLTEREQALISFDFQGERLSGELPALPGYLPLSVDEAWAQASSVYTLCETETLKPDLTKPFFGLLHSNEQLSSQTLFAFEAALLPWVVTQLKLPLAPERVSTQQLLFSCESAIPCDQAAIKIKIAREDLERDVTYCQEVRQKNPHARLRLDPNRTLGPDERELLKKLCRELDIDGVEVSADEFRHSSWSDIALLLDDSWAKTQELDLSHFKTIIFKPARDGALSAFFELTARNVALNLSSTYESYWGLESMALAARVAHLQGAQGLGTFRLLAAPPPFTLQSLDLN